LTKACFYVGIAGKEWALSRDFRDDTDELGYDQATKARIVQWVAFGLLNRTSADCRLAKERHKALQQRQMINEKILSLERKLAAQAQKQQ